MSVWDKAVEIINKAMNTEANQILGELKAACPKDSGAAAGSIHIMGKNGGDVGISAQGLITSVRIGANVNWGNHEDGGLHLYYANYGNGGPGRRIWPTRSRALNTKHGYYGMVHGYNGSHFIEAVASRHR